MFFCLVAAVKQSDFKTCSQSPFCDRQTAFAKLADLNSAPSVSLLSIDFQDGFITGRLDSSFVFNFTLFQNSVRFQLAEQDPLHARYSVADYALLNLPPKITFSKNVDSKQITVAFGNNSLIIQKSPFSFEFFSNNVPVSSFNQRGYFNYEKYREKTDDEPSAQTPVSEIDRLKDRLKANLWSEQFQSHFSDIKKGPSSIGFDIQFPGSSNVYGIPEHASGFSLKPTRGGNAIYKEPYRLYNLDVFEYELDNPMALYGSVPFLMSHKRQYSTAVLWLNAAEMWVDIEKSKEAVTSHWMAESGSLDLLYFLGPTQQEIFDAHAKITGKPQIPQEFAIAYHQCRWNYDSAQDVAQVDANFDNFDIPYDVLWLDIEHTDGKRYFTWDNAKFPKPEDMQASLASKSRKMVTIIDPHIKKDAEYSVSAKAKELDIFVKDNAGDVFSGNCWPGDSNWIDYSNPKGSQFWSERFLFGNYKGSTESLYTWNDMNEPSVFSGPEITMPKGNIHFNNVEHRDIHNLYGTLMVTLFNSA
jgi:alpha 1,3-glucosidase